MSPSRLRWVEFALVLLVVCAALLWGLDAWVRMRITEFVTTYHNVVIVPQLPPKGGVATK